MGRQQGRFDADSRVAGVTYPSGFVATRGDKTQMDAELHPIGETLGNGVATTRRYNPQNGELFSIVACGTSNAVQSLSYRYDLIGNIGS